MSAEAEVGRREATETVAVAVKSSRGKGSHRAVRWAVERSIWKDRRFVLVHVMPKVHAIPTPSGDMIPVEELDVKVVEIYMDDARANCEEIFTPLKKLLKQRNMETLVLEGDDPALMLITYISDMGISTLVLGSCFSRTSCFCSSKPKRSRVPTAVMKNASQACNVYVVSRHGVITNTRSSSLNTENSCKELLVDKRDYDFHAQSKQLSQTSSESRSKNSSGSSTNSNLIDPSSLASEQDHFHTSSFLEQCNKKVTVSDNQTIKGCSSLSSGYSVQSDIQAEVERLRQELQSTLAMYNQACEDLIYTQDKVNRLSLECQEEERKVTVAQEREERLRKMAAEGKDKHLEALEEIEMARNQCVREAHERKIAEINALNATLEKEKIVEALFTGDKRYRRYSRNEIEVATDFFSEEKLIGEGAYGKVYKCKLDHTPVAIKVLRSDASSEKKEEFLREIEVLSLRRHPHIVLLLGACPEIGCLIYEYMENGSLEDYILHGNGRPPLPWFIRLHIVYEVACGLAFLHNSGPEPIIHRDLKPGNILLDRNFVSKIGDVGLAKIISDVVPDNVTEYRNSILAGTLCYMDPEYQRTGTVRPKSDIYALGIIILQLLAACHPKGIILKFEDAMKSNSVSDILDKSVADWPLAETVELAQMALQCCKLRCRDRPDLETEILPLLRRLSEFADASVKAEKEKSGVHAPSHYYCPILQEIMEDPQIAADGFTYEYIAIKTWLDRLSISPVTKFRLQNKSLTPNHILRSAIQEWRSDVASYVVDTNKTAD